MGIKPCLSDITYFEKDIFHGQRRYPRSVKGSKDSSIILDQSKVQRILQIILTVPLKAISDETGYTILLIGAQTTHLGLLFGIFFSFLKTFSKIPKFQNCFLLKFAFF